MHGVPGGAAGLAVQVVALHEDGVVAQAAHPHVPFAFTLQLHAFPNVKPGTEEGGDVRPRPPRHIYQRLTNKEDLRRTPGSLDVLRPVHVAQLAQAEAIPSRRIHVTVHRHDRTRGLDLERLANLDVHLKVRDGAPVLRSWRRAGGARVRGSRSG